MTYYANSEYCTMNFIQLKDLLELSKSCIPLKDRINLIKERIKNRHVDDIDFQTYPSKYDVERLGQNQTDFQIELE